jgi:flagellar assembly protein FliH
MAERRSVDLALAVARKIVDREVDVNKEAVMNVVRKALEKAAENENIRVRVNPADLNYLGERKLDLAGCVDNLETVHLVADDSMSCGGCLVETTMGEVDARIDRQFQSIRELFMNEWDKSGMEDASEDGLCI